MIRCALLLTTAVLVLAGPAAAVVDPSPDVVGIYFDQNADVSDVFVPVNVPFFAYVILTNPTNPEIWGFEFSYLLTPNGPESSVFRLANILPAEAINLGFDQEVLAGDYVVGLASPLPAAPAVVLVTWQFMLLTDMSMYLELGPAPVESIPDGLPAYEAGGFIVPMGLAIGCWSPSGASVNQSCGLPIEATSFGGIKALYH